MSRLTSAGWGVWWPPQFMAEGDDDGPRSVVSGEKVRHQPRTVVSWSCPLLACWAQPRFLDVLEERRTRDTAERTHGRVAHRRRSR
jgi:hypothetical protein